MTSNIEWGHNPDGRAEAPLYRSWARRLVHVSGMPWRIVAALAGVSPTSMHRLLFGRNGRPVEWIGINDARALMDIGIDDLASASTDRIPARESRELLVALHTLGWTDHGRPRIPPVSSQPPVTSPQPGPNNTEPFQPALFELADCA